MRKDSRPILAAGSTRVAGWRARRERRGRHRVARWVRRPLHLRCACAGLDGPRYCNVLRAVCRAPVRALPYEELRKTPAPRGRRGRASRTQRAKPRSSRPAFEMLRHRRTRDRLEPADSRDLPCAHCGVVIRTRCGLKAAGLRGAIYETRASPALKLACSCTPGANASAAADAAVMRATIGGEDAIPTRTALPSGDMISTGPVNRLRADVALASRESVTASGSTTSATAPVHAP